MSEATAGPGKPRRNATATRQAILRSALVAFTRAGYDGVGVREIAQQAGVTAMLVNRYFGSKEQLFIEVVDAAFGERTLIGDDVRTLSRDVARALAAAESRSVDGFLLMLRSVANPRAAEILRAAIANRFEEHLTALLPGPAARERAALFLSLIAGVQLIREVLGSEALAEAEQDVLSTQLENLFRTLTRNEET